MHALYSYLLVSGIASAIFFAYYLLFLRHRSMHSFNRFYLLGSVAFSLLLPLLHFQWYSLSAAVTNNFPLLNISGTREIETNAVHATSSLSITQLVAILYAIVSFTLLLALALRVAWVYHIKKSGQSQMMNGYTLVTTADSKAPFSFMRTIFWKEGMDMDTEAAQQILTHELTHLKQYHTLDKLFMQLCCALCWLNPIYWLVARELAYIHEYIADEAAIQNNDTGSFARMLLQAHFGKHIPAVINPFFSSSVKQRLIMISNPKKTSYRRLRGFMALSLLGATLLLFSFKVNKGSAKAARPIVMVLDAGHGGEDNGAISKAGVKEKDLTLKVTNRLAALGKEYNIEIVPTRKDDSYPTLVNRAKMTERTPVDMFLSIHINETKATSSGYEMYVSKTNPNIEKSRLLASALSSQLSELNILPTLYDNKGLAVLRDNKVPAVLLECGDINNAAQMSMLNNDAQLDRFCRKILAAAVSYQSNMDSKK